MTAPVEKVRATDLVARLRRHYIKPGPMPGGIFLAECGINGGFGSSQRVDAVHVGFTSSSGRILTGHEIKVSRADWLHELDQTEKADLWSDQCHAWYVVAPSIDIVRSEELPHHWGLMVPNARTTTRMDVRVKATVHEDRAPSWLIVRSIMARYDTLRAEEIAEAKRKASNEAQREIREARAELAAKGTVLSDATAQRIAGILQRVGGNINGTDDEIVAAIVDQSKARHAAQALRWDMKRLVRDVEHACAPFADAYGELKELLDDSEQIGGAA